MKQIRFMFAMLLMATTLAFTACSSDDDDDSDVRDQAVGNYSGTMSIYVENEGKLVPFASELAELGEALGITFNESDFQVKGTATVSKTDGNKLIVKEDGSDGDQWVLNNIREASNGFIFDVESTTVNEVSFTNYSGYHLEGETKSYGGGFIAANNKLEFYIYTTMEEFMDAALKEANLSDEEIEGLAALLVAAGYTEEDAEEDAKQKVVVEFTLTKK
ncbi:MAG: hypothetical protein IKQ46_07600 [Bacteroidales bacterium]|nr:hypothetical protein [Bacteroidales bacterium]